MKEEPDFLNGSFIADKVIGKAAAATIFPPFVPKMRQGLTFLATIKNHDHSMRTLAVILILALLTISGAAYTDQLLTNDQQAGQRVN